MIECTLEVEDNEAGYTCVDIQVSVSLSLSLSLSPSLPPPPPPPLIALLQRVGYLTHIGVVNHPTIARPREL